MESPDPAQSKATHLLVCCANALSPGEGYRGPSLREKVSERECPWLRRRVSCCRMSSRVARGFNAGSARRHTPRVRSGRAGAASVGVADDSSAGSDDLHSSVQAFIPIRRPVATSRRLASALATLLEPPTRVAATTTPSLAAAGAAGRERELLLGFEAQPLDQTTNGGTRTRARARE